MSSAVVKSMGSVTMLRNKNDSDKSNDSWAIISLWENYHGNIDSKSKRIIQNSYMMNNAQIYATQAVE